ncbi:Signal peptide peptidase [Pycnococcus provasolii]
MLNMMNFMRSLFSSMDRASDYERVRGTWKLLPPEGSRRSASAPLLVVASNVSLPAWRGGAWSMGCTSVEQVTMGSSNLSVVAVMVPQDAGARCAASSKVARGAAQAAVRSTRRNASSRRYGSSFPFRIAAKTRETSAVRCVRAIAAIFQWTARYNTSLEVTPRTAACFVVFASTMLVTLYFLISDVMYAVVLAFFAIAAAIAFAAFLRFFVGSLLFERALGIEDWHVWVSQDDTPSSPQAERKDEDGNAAEEDESAEASEEVHVETTFSCK